jgi:abhydrolase domain-containing protein 6
MKKKLLVLSILAITLGGLWIYTNPEWLLKTAMSLERGRADLQTSKTTILSHSITYNHGGNKNGPVLLLVHGFAADKDNWTRLAAHLKEDYYMVIPDLAGHGESDRRQETVYSLAFQVEILHELMQQLGFGKFHVVGNSMGGAIAGHYYLKYPGQVLSLAFVNSGGVKSPTPSEHHLNIMKGVNKLLVNDVEDFDRLMKFVFVKPPWMPRFVKEYFARRAVRYRDFNQKIYLDAFRDVPMPLEPHLSKIVAPSLILWGSQDRVIDVSASGVFAKELPRSTLVLMEDCGHAPMIEQPEAAARHLVHFWNSLEDNP